MSFWHFLDCLLCCKWKGPTDRWCHATVLWVYGCGSDMVITSQQNKLEKLSTPFATLIRSHQEETHLRKPQSFHDALCLSLSLSLCWCSLKQKAVPASLTAGLLLCVLWLGLDLFTKMDHSASKTFSFYSPALLLYSFVLNWWPDEFSEQSCPGNKLLRIQSFFFSCRNFPLGLLFVTLIAL